MFLFEHTRKKHQRRSKTFPRHRKSFSSKPQTETSGLFFVMLQKCECERGKASCFHLFLYVEFHTPKQLFRFPHHFNTSQGKSSLAWVENGVREREQDCFTVLLMMIF